MSGIFRSYWKFVDNSRETHEMLRCIGDDSAADYNLIEEIEYESEFGHVKYWEEMKELDGKPILTPYMQIWMFPPEEVIKSEFIRSGEEGYLPGPPDEKVKREGPSPHEIKQMRQNEEMMDFITDYSDSFGGSADFLVTIDDDGEGIYSAVLTVNPEVMIEMRPAKDFTADPDVTVTVDFDFLYDMISTFEKESHIERPPWDRTPRVKEGIKGVVDKAAIASKVFGAFTTGKIKVKPVTALPKVTKILKLMFEEGPASD